MKKALSAVPFAIALFLISNRAFAAAMENAADAPVERVDLIWVVIFGILFVGMIVGFFGYFLWVERKRKQSGE